MKITTNTQFVNLHVALVRDSSCLQHTISVRRLSPVRKSTIRNGVNLETPNSFFRYLAFTLSDVRRLFLCDVPIAF
jgi:hypothetical protein